MCGIDIINYKYGFKTEMCWYRAGGSTGIKIEKTPALADVSTYKIGSLYVLYLT